MFDVKGPYLLVYSKFIYSIVGAVRSTPFHFLELSEL
jgi:hypothetical protein